MEIRVSKFPQGDAFDYCFNLSQREMHRMKRRSDIALSSEFKSLYD